MTDKTMNWPAPESLPDLNCPQRYYVLRWKHDERNRGYRRHEVRPMPVMPDDCYTIIEENMSFRRADELKKRLENELA